MDKKIEKFNISQAYLEASRCLYCDDSPCEQGCPANVPVKKFIRAIRFNNTRRAANLIREANILGGICGAICPVEKLCEKNCTNTELAYPIRIGLLQRFAIEFALDRGYHDIEKEESKDKKVAVIGAGPAGLSCAYYLALKGYDVTIFEKNEKPGGLLVYGIPVYRLSRELIEREINLIKENGVKIETNKALGKDFTIDDLFNNGFKAVFIGVGLGESAKAGIPGEGLGNFYTALDFLRKSIQSPDSLKIGKKVVIIGGGSVAMDVAVTSKKLGAEEVHIVCLENTDEMPADIKEREEAWSLGVMFNTRSKPVEITGENGKVTGLKAVRIRWKEPGKFIPSNAEEIPGTEYFLPADIVIEAIGQKTDSLVIEALKDIKMEKGKIIVDENMKTSREGVFAGGDIISGGGGTVVQSVKEGRKAAESIAQYLG